MPVRIPLSKKHGVNPSLYQCYYCGEDIGLILPGSRGSKLPGASKDGQSPMHCGVLNMDPCDKCKDYMKQGIILISMKDEDQHKKNPYRTGGWVVVTEDAINRWLEDTKVLEKILKWRWVYVPDTVWDKIGLPRGEVEKKGTKKKVAKKKVHKMRQHNGNDGDIAKCGYRPDNVYGVARSRYWKDVTCKRCLKTRKVTTP